MLYGSGSKLDFYSNSKVTYTISRLDVIGGNSIIRFTTGGTKLFLDDLWIFGDSDLVLENFFPSYGDSLFVKKTSSHLEDALSKIRFRNMKGEIGVRDYNWEYWEIGVGLGFGAIPETATYGAAVSLSGLGLVVWRKRRRRRTSER